MTNREIDALVAEEVMGLTNVRCVEFYDTKKGEHTEEWFCNEADPGDIPEYSSDLVLAWKVIDKLTGTNNFEMYRFGNVEYVPDFLLEIDKVKILN